MKTEIQLLREELSKSRLACKIALDSMTRQFPNGLPIQQGTLCEEQDWDTAIRELRSVITATEHNAFPGGRW